VGALTGITAVRPTANTQITNTPVLYGATIAAGVPVYLNTTDGEHYATDANLSATAAGAKGITITPGVDGGYGYLATGGSIILVGTTMAVGTTYYCGPTAGEIIPSGDLATGDIVTELGTAATATQLDLLIKAKGIVHA
jgi:hypothetical protein